MNCISDTPIFKEKKRCKLLIFIIIAVIVSFLVLVSCATTGDVPLSKQALSPQMNPILWVQHTLIRREPVTLAIMSQSILNPSIIPNGEEYFYHWAAGIESSMVSEWEQGFLYHCSGLRNFKVVDRNSIEKIINEYHFQMSGLTRQIDAQQLGQFLNSSHILLLSFSRNVSGKNKYNDLETAKLISVKDASIVSVMQVRTDGNYERN